MLNASLSSFLMPAVNDTSRLPKLPPLSETNAPGASVANILAAANWPDSREPVLIVGHQPSLGAVASFLLSGEEAYWSVRKGAVWWLSDRAKEGGAAVVLKVVLGPDFA